MIRPQAAPNTVGKISAVSGLILTIVELPQLACLAVGTLLVLITILTLTAALSTIRVRRDAAYRVLQLLSRDHNPLSVISLVPSFEVLDQYADNTRGSRENLR